MRASLLLAVLPLLASAPAAQKKPTFDPLFDYTHLRPTDTERWNELTAGEVTMFQALDIALNASQGKFFTLSARLVWGDDPVWRIETIEVDGEGQPHRVDVEVGIHEPKVKKRLELLALAPGEVAQWRVLKDTTTSLWKGISLGVDLLNLDPAKEVRTMGRGDNAFFVAEPKNPHYELEIWCWNNDTGVPNRTSTLIDARKELVTRQILLDRFPGLPLREASAIEREDGIYLHDFIVGDGPLVEAESRVKVNYRLFLLDMTKLHDTWQTKRPEDFVVSQAPFKGLAIGMPGMRVGGKRKIVMPYDLAFGEAGNEIAPPRAMVVCDIQVEAIAN